jgi:hypothetical protein
VFAKKDTRSRIGVSKKAKYLYSGLVELGGPGQLLPAVDVRVVALRKGGLKLLQLLLGEGGPVPSSATLKGQCHEHCINYYRQGSSAPAAVLLGEGRPVPTSATLKGQWHESCIDYYRQGYPSSCSCSWVKVVRCRLLQHY